MSRIKDPRVNQARRENRIIGDALVGHELRLVALEEPDLEGAAPRFTVGLENAGTNTAVVAVQLRGFDGLPIAYQAAVNAYLSTTKGGATSAVVPAGGVAIANRGTVQLEEAADVAWRIITDASGRFDLGINHGAGAQVYFLNVIWNGRVYSSGPITFA